MPHIGRASGLLHDVGDGFAARFDVTAKDACHLLGSWHQQRATPPWLVLEFGGLAQHDHETGNHGAAHDAEDRTKQTVDAKREARTLYEIAEQAREDPALSLI